MMNNKQDVAMLIRSFWRSGNEGFKHLLLKEIYKLVKEDLEKEIDNK